MDTDKPGFRVITKASKITVIVECDLDIINIGKRKKITVHGLNSMPDTHGVYCNKRGSKLFVDTRIWTVCHPCAIWYPDTEQACHKCGGLNNILWTDKEIRILYTYRCIACECELYNPPKKPPTYEGDEFNE